METNDIRRTGGCAESSDDNDACALSSQVKGKPCMQDDFLGKRGIRVAKSFFLPDIVSGSGKRKGKSRDSQSETLRPFWPGPAFSNHLESLVMETDRKDLPWSDRL